MKLHFNYQRYGKKGMQHYIRKSRELSLYMEQLIKSDDRFELFPKNQYALVCFRLKKQNKEEMDKANYKLLDRLDNWERTAIVGGSCADEFFLRISLSHDSKEEHLEEFWKKVLELSLDL